ncbi:uncharacterized protein YjbJ (UPF0337 family) [Streptomyces sp. PanSC19]|nr:uncharacterized protein YjbJ (UPF0337 family) [Streptomyces sp. PanSC19]
MRLRGGFPGVDGQDLMILLDLLGLCPRMVCRLQAAPMARRALGAASIDRAAFGLRARDALFCSSLSIDRPFFGKGAFLMAEKAKGKMEQAKGKAKEVVGKATGNERMKAEGKTDQVKGKTREVADKGKEQARGVKDSLRDRRQP